VRSDASSTNTVIEPGVDVNADVEAINAGRATRVNGNFVVNGRTYGAHDGTLYPISGTGFHQLSRAQFKALGVLNQFGETARSNEILTKMNISEADRTVASRAHKASR